MPSSPLLPGADASGIRTGCVSPYWTSGTPRSAMAGSPRAWLAQVADSVLAKAFHEGAHIHRTDIACDVYWETSVKNAERCNIGSASGIQWKNIAPGHNILHEENLLTTLGTRQAWSNFWWIRENSLQSMTSLCVKPVERCADLLTKDHWNDIQALNSAQEEVDTRRLPYAESASEHGYRSVAITAEDTDVLILFSLPHRNVLPSLSEMWNAKTFSVYLDITKLTSAIGENICQSLIGLHAFSGYDTVNVFAGRGKISALKHLRASDTHQQVFKQLDEDETVSSELFEKLGKLVCWMYASSTTTCEVTELRCHSFGAKHGDVELSWLAKTFSTCTSSTRNIKLRFGESVLGVNRLCHIERDMGGPQA